MSLGKELKQIFDRMYIGSVSRSGSWSFFKSDPDVEKMRGMGQSISGLFSFPCGGGRGLADSNTRTECHRMPQGTPNQIIWTPPLFGILFLASADLNQMIFQLWGFMYLPVYGLDTVK